MKPDLPKICKKCGHNGKLIYREHRIRRHVFVFCEACRSEGKKGKDYQMAIELWIRN